jgi:hypothetical protein
MRRLTALVAAAAGLAAVTAAVAQDPAITLSIGKSGGGPQGEETTVMFGDKVRVSGSISPARPGETVSMQVTRWDGRKSNHTLVTNSQGRFELIHRPALRTEYEARWDGGDFLVNREVVARVRPKVFLRVRSVRRSSRHMTIRFSMRMVAVRTRGDRVWAILQRRVTGTSWTPKLTISSIDGLSASFTATFRRGTQRVRIVVGGGTGYLKGTSRVVVVRP